MSGVEFLHPGLANFLHDGGEVLGFVTGCGLGGSLAQHNGRAK